MAPHLLHLVRHGHHAEVGVRLSGRSAIALDERGRAEAEALAAPLAANRPATLYSSPQQRARETAAPLAQRTGLPVQLAEALAEIDFGRFAGRRFDELAADPDWQRWNEERGSFRCPDGETMAEAVARARAFLDAVPRSDLPAIAFTHCDIIRGVVADLLGLPLARMFAFDCDPGSVTTLAREGGGWRLVSLNNLPARPPAPPAHASSSSPRSVLTPAGR